MTRSGQSIELTMLRVMVTAVALILTAFFLYIGTVKVFGWPNAEMLAGQTRFFFDRYGLTRQMVVMIGVAEIFGGLTVSLHRIRWIGLLGAAVLLTVSIGALFFHLRYDTFQTGMAAFRTMTLSAFVLSVGGILCFRPELANPPAPTLVYRLALPVLLVLLVLPAYGTVMFVVQRVLE